MNYRLRPQCLEQDIRYALYHGQSIIDHDQYEKVDARRRARGAIDGEQKIVLTFFYEIHLQGTDEDEFRLIYSDLSTSAIGVGQ